MYLPPNTTGIVPILSGINSSPVSFQQAQSFAPRCIYAAGASNPKTKSNMNTYQAVLVMALVVTTFTLGRISTRL